MTDKNRHGVTLNGDAAQNPAPVQAAGKSGIAAGEDKPKYDAEKIARALVAAYLCPSLHISAVYRFY